MALTQSQIREYDRRAMDSAETTTATFGIGCFWGPDAQFGAIEGVVRALASATPAERHSIRRITS